ncbi:HTH-type transcriptional repressor AseR [Anaerohalosphaera lusitana]|uniref:HTH-type transcriptional repressor AseR n=1 Tax=Anaerohalosphaera lusitana TaxID=1936003 RepID=A0A1U9NH66_9BACT|nr:HTH-type transcriptional repressor AseR [Anaerohalosphaera lusitana]
MLRALGDEGRVRVVLALAEHGELCACQIVELVGLAGSTVSKHLSVLKNAGLVERRKKGRWIHYSFSCGEYGSIVMGYLKHWLDEDEQIVADREKMNEILREDPEIVCRRQKRN